MPEETWQPARLVKFHDLDVPDSELLGEMFTDEEIAPLFRKVVRVRPIEPSAERLEIADILDCDATRFFQLHPDDRLPEHEDIIVLCEHEVLSD